jgi:hypothetical protein
VQNLRYRDEFLEMKKTVSGQHTHEKHSGADQTDAASLGHQVLQYGGGAPRHPGLYIANLHFHPPYPKPTAAKAVHLHRRWIVSHQKRSTKHSNLIIDDK